MHVHVATNSPEMADEALQQVYAKARMGRVGDPVGFSYHQDVQGDSDLSLGSFHFGGHGEVGLVLEDTLTVVRPRAGGHRWEVGGRRGTGTMMIQPGVPYQAQLELLTVDTVDFGLPALRETARTVYGDDRLELSFGDPRPAFPARDGYWRSSYEFVRQVLSDPAMSSVDMLRADLLRRISVATLETFALSSGPRTLRSTTAARQAAYRRAVEFMQASLSLPITLEDVARYAGTSTVELARTFRHHAGTTPGAWLRELRLGAAHRDLVDGNPADGDTVREIALRWAMPYPGDFARRYRRAYGRNPGRTLRG